MLNLKQRIVANNSILKNNLFLKISQALQKIISEWEEDYKTCTAVGSFNYIVPKTYKSINIEFNFLTQKAYLMDLWSKFISSSLNSFLSVEMYYWMQDYLLISEQQIQMKEDLCLFQPGRYAGLDLSEIFNFIPNSNMDRIQSFEIIRIIMESTMFDLFAIYLELAINKVEQLKEQVVFSINSKDFGHNSLYFAKQKLIELEEIFTKLNSMQTKFSEKYVNQFKQQINFISAKIRSNDIFHLTFGTSGHELQLFPFIVDDENRYVWATQFNLNFGDHNSSYFGLHVDPIFADFLKLSASCNSFNLQLSTNEFGSDLENFSNKQITKNNVIFFNGGNIDLLYRNYSKKFNKFFSITKYIELSIIKLNELLKQGVIVVLGSHFSDLDEDQQIVGPFKLKELILLKNEYPYDLHIAFGGPYKQPDLMESLSNKIEDILGYNRPMKSLLVFSEDKNFSFLSTKAVQGNSFDEDKVMILSDHFNENIYYQEEDNLRILSNNSFQIIESKLCNSDHKQIENEFNPNYKYKCVIS